MSAGQWSAGYAGAGEVVTGEAVVLDLRPARLASRGLAFAIDAVLQLLALGALVLVVGSLAETADPALRATIGLLATLSIFLGYPVLAETLWRGRTVGKAALGLRAVRLDGGPIRFRQALTRGLFAVILDVWGTAGLVGLVASMANRRGQRVGDVLAGTMVLQERVPARGGPVATMPLGLVGWAAGLDLSGLPDGLALAARQFQARQEQLTPAARESLGGSLAAAVTAAVTPPPPPGTPGWQVLAAVLAERRRRDELRLRRQAGAAPASVAPAPMAPQQPPPPRGDGFTLPG